MGRQSSVRRRLMAVGFFFVGLAVVWFHERLAPELVVKVFGPTALLYGLTGLAFPAAVHDFIKPEFGALQLWVDSSRWPLFLGVSALLVGACIGTAWYLTG